MTIHSARITNSFRLQTLLKILADGQEYTTAEIEDRARVLAARGEGQRLCAVHTCAAELRHRGIAVTVQRRGPHWFYRLGAA